MLSSIPHKYVKSKEAYKNIIFTKGNRGMEEKKVGEREIEIQKEMEEGR